VKAKKIYYRKVKRGAAKKDKFVEVLGSISDWIC